MSSSTTDAKTDIIVAYNPTQFYYVSATADIPAKCDNYLETDYCKRIDNNSTLSDLSNCYLKQICLNKKYANEINNLQNNHLGSGQGYNDIIKLYDSEYDKTLNFVLSIVFLIGAIYYTKNSSL